MTPIAELDWNTRLRCLAFQCLERTLDWVRPGTPDPAAQARVDHASPGGGLRPWLWLFVSTIGELNAVEPFLRRLRTELGNPGLVLLTDHAHYRPAYLAKLPDAHVWTLTGAGGELDELTRSCPPGLLVIAEIPCMLWEAPCRFPFAIVHAVKRRHTPVCVANGWLYGQAPSCRMDAIERRWLGAAYLRLIDLFMVQTEEVRMKLLAAGVAADRVIATGNIKFDALQPPQRAPEQRPSRELLEAIRDSRRPCIVAGCVTNLDEQQPILDVFARVREAFADALLVLAPRHPENRARMEHLKGFLRERRLRFAFRSRADREELDRAEVLVLDTLGELRDFYAVSTLSYVGLNHNVLEPLAFGKAVFVSAGWNPRFPSYPVYCLLRDQGLIQERHGVEDLARGWLAVLQQPRQETSEASWRADRLAELAGASERNLHAMRDRGLLSATAHGGRMLSEVRP